MVLIFLHIYRKKLYIDVYLYGYCRESFTNEMCHSASNEIDKMRKNAYTIISSIGGKASENM